MALLGLDMVGVGPQFLRLVLQPIALLRAWMPQRDCAIIGNSLSNLVSFILYFLYSFRAAMPQLLILISPHQARQNRSSKK
jgi:hypothetical protein